MSSESSGAALSGYPPPLPDLGQGVASHPRLGQLYDKLQVDQRMVSYAHDFLAAFMNVRGEYLTNDASREEAIRDALRIANARWFALAMNAASYLEDAANCLRDAEARGAALGAADHVRKRCHELFDGKEVWGE
jgi:hypothetical protein